MRSLISLNQDAQITHVTVWITGNWICVKPNKWISKERILVISNLTKFVDGWIICKNSVGYRIPLHPGNNYKSGKIEGRCKIMWDIYIQSSRHHLC